MSDLGSGRRLPAGPGAGGTSRAPAARRCWALAVALATAIVAVGCSGGAPADSILLYNGQHPQVTGELVKAFEHQTGIKVEVRTDDGIVLADQLLQEGEATPADVYLTENSPELVDLDRHGMLAKLGAATLAQIPAPYEASNGDWVGMAQRVSALAYNPGLVPKGALPRSVLELAQPAWQGKVAIAPTDSDFPPLVGAVIATYGRHAAAAWLTGLKRNAQLFQSDEAVVAAVNGGSVATGIINHYYWYRLRLELGTGAIHSALYFFPEQNVGSVKIISGAAVLEASHHPQEAQAFVNFLVGPVAQRILARGYDFEYPLRPGVRPNSALRPLSAIRPATVDANALGDDQQAAQLIQEAGLA